MAITIEHDEKRSEFYFEEDGKRGVLKYFKEGKVLDLSHTHVPVPLEGQGYGNALVKAALKYAKDEGYKIIPSCPFVAAYVKRHRSARPLVAH